MGGAAVLTEGQVLDDYLRRLQSVTAALATARSDDDIAAAVIDHVLPAVGAAGGVLALLDDEGMLQVVRIEGYGPVGDEFNRIAPDARLPLPEALRTGTPVWITSPAERLERFPASAAIPFNHQALCAVPLVASDGPLGVVGATFASPRTFEEHDRSFLATVAQQCAIALERCRLEVSVQARAAAAEAQARSLEAARREAEESAERMRQLADALQTSLLPPTVPEVPGMELSARYLSALRGLEVGGDFYDVFDTGGDWAVMIGDVCGKGPEAAALTALARYTLRSVAMDVRHPAQVLRKLNDVLLREQLDERFLTVAYARVVPAVGGVRISVCRGGHPPPLLVRASGEVEPLGFHGGLLGLFPDIRLWEETAQLVAGDSVVFYTDGVVEATRDGEQFGDRRMEQVLGALAGDKPDVMAATLEAEVLAFGGSRPRDDVAILVLQAAPE